MLTTLSIKNYALIEDIRVDLSSGMTIITGETGAGKSILLGALALLLGKRADANSVKDASKKCVIEAEFSLADYDLQDVFEENDLDYEPHTIIRRELLPSGKSRAFVNDTPVTVGQLQALGVHLVDIHSQHETLALSSETYQLEVIDALAGHSSLLKQYSQQYTAYTEASEALSEMKAKKQEAIKELDYQTFLFEELEQAKLEGLDQMELEETYEKLSNSEAIQENLATIDQLFNEEQIGTIETAKTARTALGKVRGFASEYEALWNRLNSVIIELEDIAETVSQAAGDIEADPQQLFQLNEKLQTIHKLQLKHSVASVDELLEIKAALGSQIDGTQQLDDRIAELENKVINLEQQTTQIASELHQGREKVIPTLKEKLESFLGALGLPNAKFQFEIEQQDTFRKNGKDTLALLFTANKGLPFGSLKKIASGGEMSRIMLAVKAVLSQYKKLPTIIFDEIDTGVSGEIAHAMASIMSAMSEEMQLLSITHLPQIAAKGEHHIKIYKEDVNEVTVTRLRPLAGEERIIEIAQMIGGKQVSDVAIANAKELLN